MKVIAPFILLCTLLFMDALKAQTYVDIIHTGYRQNAAVEYEGFENEFYAATGWVNVNKPIVLNEAGDILTPAFLYEFNQLHHDVYEDGRLRMHNFELGLSWLKRLNNENWATYLDFGTAMSSDLHTVNKTHFNYGGTALVYYGKNSDLVWNAGVNFSGGAFGVWWVPLVGVDWNINKNIVFSFQTFSHTQLDIKLKDRWYAGIQSLAAPFSYNISEYYGIKDSYVYSYSDKFPFSPQQLGVYSDVYVGNEKTLFAKAGFELSKTIYHLDAQGAVIEESAYNGKLNPGFFFEIGFAWRKRTARKFDYQ